MPATKQRVIRFDDWSGGEFGDFGAYNAPPRSFTAKNMLRYKNGTVGPRPGLKNLGVTGVTTGTVWGFRGLGTQTKGMAFCVTNTAYGFTYGVANAASAIATIPSITPPVIAQIIQYGNKGLTVISGGDPYRITPPSTVTQVSDADAPGGTVIAVYGSRVVIAGVSATPNRVYYSDATVGQDAAQNITSWTSTSYFDVGSNDATIVYMEELRRRLVIALDNGEWWAVTGTPGVDDTLFRLPREDATPPGWWAAARLKETVLFTPYSQDWPVQFTAAVTDKLGLQHLSFANGGQIGACAAPGLDVFCFVEAQSTGGRMLVFNNDVWTYHTIENSVKSSRLVSNVGWSVDPSSNAIVLCDGGSVSTPAKFYAFSPYLDRPGKTGDTYAQPGDDSTTPLVCYLYTPEWWAPGGENIAVRGVRVDFLKWNTGSASTNHFEVTIRTLHRAGTASTVDSAAGSFDEATSATSSDETADSRYFRFGEQGVGHGFQIRIDAIRGCAIDRILVDIIEDPARV